MNRMELIRATAAAMREKNIRKLVSSPKHVFHISDDEGNKKDFVVRQIDKGVQFTTEDVEAVLDTCMQIIEEAIKRGDPVSIRGFGTLGLKYRKSRVTKMPGTGERIDVGSRFVPKFTFGNDLRMCAKVYELSLADKQIDIALPVFDEGGEEDAD